MPLIFIYMSIIHGYSLDRNWHQRDANNVAISLDAFERALREKLKVGSTPASEELVLALLLEEEQRIEEEKSANVLAVIRCQCKQVAKEICHSSLLI